MKKTLLSLSLFFSLALSSYLHPSQIKLGIDVFFLEEYLTSLKNKNIGIITNQTGVDSSLQLTAEKFIAAAKNNNYSVKAFFSPEHGFYGNAKAGAFVENNRFCNIPVYSLHGKTRRPTKEMLQGIDVLIYDIQDIGSRSYTYATTLFYIMEEAKKYNLEIVVLDRPNPINGLIVDGPVLDNRFRSFVGYINTPYCHGMTIGEMAKYFNEEYSIGCNLTVVPMKGWKRSMSFKDTGLTWIPTSPNIPEEDSAFFYPSTGIMGELKILNIGIGYTLPFKIFGAPWMDGKLFSDKLNAQKLAGVKFIPFNFCPFYGLYKEELCGGVKIVITDKEKYKPLAVQYLILGMLKSIYPKVFIETIEKSDYAKELFHKINGTDEIYNILIKEPYPAWKLIEFQENQKQAFLKKREKYLFKEYLD